MNLLDCFIRNLETRVSEDLYWLFLCRIDRKYRYLCIKWNDVSRRCYELEQQLQSGNNRVLKKYNKAITKAEKIKNKVAILKQERNQFVSR